MVEVVVRPVGGEHRLVLAVEELVELDDVRQPLRLLDRLRAVEELLDVVARPLLQQRDLAAALDVLLVEAVQDATESSRTRPP